MPTLKYILLLSILIIIPLLTYSQTLAIRRQNDLYYQRAIDNNVDGYSYEMNIASIPNVSFILRKWNIPDDPYDILLFWGIGLAEAIEFQVGASSNYGLVSRVRISYPLSQEYPMTDWWQVVASCEFLNTKPEDLDTLTVCAIGIGKYF